MLVGESFEEELDLCKKNEILKMKDIKDKKNDW